MPIITIHHATNFAETVDGLDDRIFETVGWFPTKSQALVVEPVFDRDVFGRFQGVPILDVLEFVEPEEDEEEIWDEEEYVKEFWDAAANLTAFDITYIIACVGRVDSPFGRVPCIDCMWEGFTQGGFTHFCDHCRQNNDENNDYGAEPDLLTCGSWSWGLDEKMNDPIEDEDDDYWSDEDDWSEGTGFTPEFM